MFKRLIKYFVALLGSQGISFANNILLVPLFLRRWPTEVYGEWLALSSVAAYFSTLDLINAAVSNRMLAAYSRDDMEDYRRCQHSALVFYGALAIATTSLTGLAAFCLPIARMVGLKSTSAHDAALTMWLLGLQVLLMMPAGFISNLYRSIGDPARTQWVNNTRLLLSMVFTAIALLFGASMPVLALVQLAPIGLVTIFVLADLRLRMPSLLPGVKYVDRGVVRELLAPSLQFAIIMVAAALQQQGSVLVVSLALGGVAVAIFVTTRTLTNLVMQLFMTINYATQPTLTVQFAQGDLQRLRRVQRLLVATTTSLCIAVAATLWFEGPDVIAHWTHQKITVTPLFLHLMLLYIVLQAPWRGCSMIAISTNRHRSVSYSSIVSSGIGVAVAAALVHRIGINAVPIGLIVGEAISCYHFVVQDACRLVEENYPAFAARLWGGVLATGAFALCIGWIGHAVARGPDVLRWCEDGAFVFICVGCAAWFLWFTPVDRAALVHRIRVARGKAVEADKATVAGL